MNDDPVVVAIGNEITVMAPWMDKGEVRRWAERLGEIAKDDFPSPRIPENRECSFCSNPVVCYKCYEQDADAYAEEKMDK
jgi:hypothetical protein